MKTYHLKYKINLNNPAHSKNSVLKLKFDIQPSVEDMIKLIKAKEIKNKDNIESIVLIDIVKT